MHSRSGLFILIFSVLLFSACKKKEQPSEQQVIPADLVGEWKWVQSDLGNLSLTPATSGVQRKLTLSSTGSFTLTHNDSTGKIPELGVVDPVIMLPSPVVSSGSYKVIEVTIGCTGARDIALIVGGQGGYAFTVSNDTLHVSPGGCLLAYRAIYVRSK
jgi:hypothetical protein